MISWRLIDTGPLDGVTNMAVDSSLLASFDPDRDPPLLRLYGWSPPAFSHGRFQDAREVLDLERCVAAGVPVVRRITGGGVIYHADELTYAIVCAPHHIPPAASIKASFRVLTTFLLRFYRKLGLEARYAVDHYPAGTRLGERTPFCFAGRESYDILVDGRKIGGNAQRRIKNAIFQHGSIPLVNRAALGGGFLRETTLGVGEASGALRDFGVGLPPSDLKECLKEAFMEAFPLMLEEGSLNEKEEAAAASFALEKP